VGIGDFSGTLRSQVLGELAAADQKKLGLLPE
jgi:hypothetical protein